MDQKGNQRLRLISIIDRAAGGTNPNGGEGRGSESIPGAVRLRRGVQTSWKRTARLLVQAAGPGVAPIFSSSLLLLQRRPAMVAASNSTSSSEIGRRGGAGMISGVSEFERCAQFVRGWSPYIGSSCACREVTDDDHGGDATASCGHGRWWRSIHGVIACVTGVLARRAVV